jgi:hypothetical protein
VQAGTLSFSKLFIFFVTFSNDRGNMMQVSLKITLTAALFLSLAACGSKKGSTPVKEGGNAGLLQSKLNEIATKSEIPPRLLLAVAWMESGLNAKSSFVTYLKEPKKQGFSVGESAFGMDRISLGLGEDERSDDLTTQASAWAGFIKNKMFEADVRLTATPTTLEEKLRWIWELAQIQRGGTKARSDVRSLFARELITTLNTGFLWQSEAGDVIRLPVENPPIDLQKLPPAYKELLELDTTTRSDSPHADFLPLASVVGVDGNVPNHIEIIHCPFSISACLELQIPKEGSDTRLEAHYVIPEDRSLLKGPIQITRHTQAVHLTSPDGTLRKVNDGIVIMLVGSSGRLTNGVRSEADPSWLTKIQLMDLAVIAEDVCHAISLSKLNTEENCMNIPLDRPASPLEAKVHISDKALVTWGDVPDFDPMIFSAYFRNPGNDLPGGLKLSAKIAEVKAGEPLKVDVTFTDRVRQIVFERMVRCPDNSVSWTKVAESQIRYSTAYQDQFQFWDAGPNNNGTHFLRAKAYGKEGLLGWDLLKVYTKEYDRDFAGVLENCRK